MIFDKYISYKQKVIIAVICAGLWIYFRTSDCYSMIPRLHIFPVIFVMCWSYINYYEPLALPTGLLLLIIYKVVNKKGLLNYVK
jgi:hypothetical protein